MTDCFITDQNELLSQSKFEALKARVGMIVFLNLKIKNHRFEGYNFRLFHFHDCVFEECDFSEQPFSEAAFKNSRFINCKFCDTSFNDYKLNKSEFIECNFSRTKFTGDAQHSTFEKCNFSDCHFVSVNFDSSSFLQSNMSGAKFRWCSLKDTKWDGVKISPKTVFEYCTFNPRNSTSFHDVFNDKSDRVVFKFPYYFWNWNRLSKLGRLPALEFSWALFTICLFILSTLIFLNESKFISQGITYPIPIPKQLMWLTMGSFLTSLGTFCYRFGCPDRIQNFTESEWVEDHGHPRIFYREFCVKKTFWLWISSVLLALGLCILGYLMCNRIVHVLEYLLWSLIK